MRKSNIIIKKVRNLMILSMAVIVIISVYFNILNSRAKETTDIVVNVTDETGEVDSQKVTLVATGNKNGNYEISLPETISNVYVSNYKTLNGDKSANDKIILSQDEVENKEINLEVNYDKKNVTSTETNEEMTLYKQNLEYDDKGIYVEGYMPLLAQINVIQNENDISLEILYTVVESNNTSKKEIYVPSEYGQTLEITLNKKMYVVEQSLISSTDAEYIVVEQSNSELVINPISSNTINITNEEVPTIISSQYNGEDNKYYFAGGPIANSQIESIKFVTNPKEVLGTKWDASENGDNSVIAGYIDSNGNELYEIYVASNSDKTTKVYTPEDASYMFYECSNLTTIDIQNLGTSKTINMNSMFAMCTNITTLELQNFDTSNVEDMENMFFGCENLETLDISNFITAKVTTMCNMFQNCKKLTELNLESFDTSKVIDMNSMFNGCESLTILNLNNFNTTEVTDMSWMFYNCKNITTLDLSNFDTSNVIDMSAMFSTCENLTTLNISNFNTTEVTDMNAMFSDCKKLQILNLSNFNISKVEDMSFMFSGCIKLSELDLGKQFTKIANENEGIFDGLEENQLVIKVPSAIYAGENEIKLNNGSTDIITFLDNVKVECKYKIEWKKVSSSVDIAQKQINVVLQAEGVNTTYDSAKILTDGISKYLQLYIDEKIVDNLTVTIENQEVKNGKLQCTLKIKNEEIKDGEGIALVIKEDSATDKYGNGNLEKKLIIAEPLPIMQNTQYNGDDNKYYFAGGTIENSKIESIKFVASKEEVLGTQWDASENGNNSVIAGYVDSNNNGLYEIYVASNSEKTTKVYLPEDASYMFYECNNLTTIDLQNINTSKTINMNSMFATCNNITTLDLSGFDTSEVTDMNSMFFECRNLTTLNVSNFDTVETTDISWMFYNCNNLTTLDLSSFNVNKVADMSSIFSKCSNLETLDLGKQFTQIPSEYENMFDGIGSNKTLIIYVPETIYSGEKEIRLNNTSEEKIQVSNNVTINCKYRIDFKEVSKTINAGQKQIDLVLQAEGVNTTYNLTKLTSENLEDYIEIYANGVKRNDVTLTLVKQEVISGNLQCTLKINYGNIQEDEGTKLVIKRETVQDEYGNGNLEYELALIEPTPIIKNTQYNGSNNKYYFAGGTIENSKIESIKFVSSKEAVIGTKWDASENGDNSVIAGYIDSNNNGLYEIYIASNSVKTTKVYTPEDVSYMFYSCNNLTTIDVQNLDTSKTINMNSMFAICNNITTLNLSSFDTSKVIDMENMFYKNEKLVTLDISSFNTSEVTTMSNMFSNCTSLTNLDLNNFNTSKVTDMNSMFFECRNLATLNISNFNTSQVTDMSYMFYNNQKLTTINVSNFNTSNTVYMGAMFSGCSAITTLDISNFDISKVEDMSSMFRRCSNLTTLDLGKKFTQIASEYGDMFDGIGSNTTLVIKVPEAIYSGEKEIRLNNTSEEKIQFSNNVTIDCKYRIDWKKISSTINTEQKQIELILQAEGINTTYSSNKLTNSNLEKYFEIYVDREKTTDINISINNQEVINNKLQCTLTLGFENAVESGEVSILIKRGTAQDQYENSNLEQKIIVDSVDFIKPSIKYTYSKSDIDKDNKTLTINFTATDKNLDTVASVLQKSDLSLAIYNYDSNGKGYWKNVDISDANNTFTQNINGKEID